MLILGAADVYAALPMSSVIQGVEQALREFSLGRVVAPIRQALEVVPEQERALFMPAYVEAVRGLGLKFLTVFPRNRHAGQPIINGVVILADPDDGRPEVLLEAASLTALRTGAIAGAAARYLAPPGADVLAVIGTGAQSSGIVRAICTVCQIREIRLFNRTPEKAHMLAQQLRTEHDCEIRVTEFADEAVHKANLVVTATTSSVPVFSEESLAYGSTVIAMGAFSPLMQEVPPEVVVRADKVVVESREAALQEAGDLIQPIQKGLFHETDIYAELGEIISGQRPGRERQDEVIVFKSVGLAVIDVVVGRLVYERACTLGMGHMIDLYGEARR